jgi:hypothetical protein
MSSSLKHFHFYAAPASSSEVRLFLEEKPRREWLAVFKPEVKML